MRLINIPVVPSPGILAADATATTIGFQWTLQNERVDAPHGTSLAHIVKETALTRESWQRNTSYRRMKHIISIKILGGVFEMPIPSRDRNIPLYAAQKT